MTGQIRRRGERSWELKFDLEADPRTGKRVTKYHSFKGTKREAQAELVRLKAAADRGDYVDPVKTTLSEFLNKWETWAATQVAAMTLERYRELLRRPGAAHCRARASALAPHLDPVCADANGSRLPTLPIFTDSCSADW